MRQHNGAHPAMRREFVQTFPSSLVFFSFAFQRAHKTPTRREVRFPREPRLPAFLRDFQFSSSSSN